MLAQYTWDTSLTADSSAGPGLDLSSFGVTDLTPSSDCKDGTCVRLSQGKYLRVPSHNFGQYNGLSVSLWFKPLESATIGGRLFDFGSAAEINNMYITHNTDGLWFIVRSLNGGPADFSTYVTTTGWQVGSWTHLVWVLMPSRTWKIFINGELAATVANVNFVADATLTASYIGWSNWAGETGFNGYMDSFMIFATALSDQEARGLYTVGFSLSLYLQIAS